MGFGGTPAKVKVVLVDYDPRWPRRFDEQRSQITAALGDRALAVDHIGSTSVPGLAAKPIVDICLTVADSADEPSYIPDLVATGFELRFANQPSTSTGFSEPPTAVCTSMSSRRALPRSCDISSFAIGCAATLPIGRCTRRRSGSLPSMTGRLCSTTPTRNPRSSRRSSREPSSHEASASRSAAPCVRRLARRRGWLAERNGRNLCVRARRGAPGHSACVAGSGRRLW